jgi:tRNA A-37 threonylcarbamoyl transferase component Bud32
MPEQFGKYSLLGHLATGGMAEVWLARQLGLEGFEKIVVIKRARPELTDRDTTRRFLDEARLVATLEHPNIAQVYEIGSVSGSYFFVMEYIDGADLRRLIETSVARHRPVSLADALYIIIHVCTALHYAHEKRDLEGRPLHIVHRDVTPSNVLLSHDGTIKVCDFGIAKAHNREAENTKNGVLKGKFSYMSPEQCESKPVDRRSDVFSIGILLYELTTLSKLFRGASDYALLQKIIEAPVPPPSSRLAGYPPELEHIVMKALAKSPHDRYQTAQAMQLDLEDFAREHKLAMSSVRIAQMMGGLFEQRNDAWIRAQRALSDQVIGEYNAGGSGTVPPFLAIGSAPSLPRGALAAETPAPMTGSQLSRSAIGATLDRGPSVRSAGLWLVGAVLAGLVAGAVTVADQMITSAGDRSTVKELTADADRIATVFDAAARAAHMRADGIATTPMLRAAIETDAATLHDLASTEMVFTGETGETLEVFQIRNDHATSLLRIPKSAPGVQALAGRDTRVTSDSRGVTLLASAPISGYGAVLAGGLVIAMPVDLMSIRRALEDHAVRASLTGLGKDITLAGPSDGVWIAPLKLAVPSSSAWGSGTATLVVTPKQAVGLAWAWQARTASGGLAALLLAGFIVGLARRPRS